MYTRRGNDVTSRFPAVTDADRRMPARLLMFDVELVAMWSNGRPDPAYQFPSSEDQAKFKYRSRVS